MHGHIDMCAHTHTLYVCLEQVSDVLLVVLTVPVPMGIIAVATLLAHFVCKQGATNDSVRAPLVVDANTASANHTERRCSLPSGCNVVRVMVVEILKLLQTQLLTIFITLGTKLMGGRCAEHTRA